MKRLAPVFLIALVACSTAGSVPAGNGRVDPAKVRRELKRILSLPEYNRSYHPSLLDKLSMSAGKIVKKAVTRFIGWIVRHLSFGDLTGAGILASLGAWAVAVIFVVLVGLVVRKLLTSGGGQDRERESAADPSHQMPSAKPLIGQAAKLAEAGDYRAAFRAAYLASIAYLDQISALRFERSRTNWEYLRELQAGGHEKPHAELRPLTADFDRKIYGREECGRQDYANAAAVYARLSGEAAG
jgi:hypothetical protein